MQSQKRRAQSYLVAGSPSHQNQEISSLIYSTNEGQGLIVEMWNGCRHGFIETFSKYYDA